MNQRTQTLIAVAIALVAVSIAWLTRPSPIDDARFALIGQPIAPELTDPAQVASLEVIAYDEESARHLAFKVAFDGQRWLIASASDYPADAAAKIAEAASAFVGLERESIVTDRKIDHASLGLVDPADESGDPAGRGVRVTIRDASGRTLADLIVGHETDEIGRINQRYIREADSDRAYRTTFQSGLASALSINLVDWIDTDLLRVTAEAITQIRLDAYSVDEAKGHRTTGERFQIARSSTDNGWIFEPGGAIADRHASTRFATDLAGLRIDGVVLKPTPLASLLAGEQSNATLDAEDLQRMARSGFFLSQDGHLIANAGEVRFDTSRGLRYTLWFGEILARTNAGGAIFESGRDSGMDDQIPGSRAMLVTVEAIDQQDANAAETAQMLSKKYADWWYLIDETTFISLHPDATSLMPVGQPE